MFGITHPVMSAPMGMHSGGRLAGAVTDEWAGRDVELPGRREELAARLGTPPGPDTDMILYGQSAAFVTAVRPAADVVRTVCQEAESVLRSRPTQLLD